MASTIPLASEIRTLVNDAINKVSQEREIKIKNQVDKILGEISTELNKLAKYRKTSTEYFVDNGDMNEPDIDDDLRKGGQTIIRVCEVLENAGYFTSLYEGKFKQMNRYGTFITISLDPIERNDY